MDMFIGTILPFAGDYAPQDWLFCDGRIMQINQYAALFAVVGNRYGGDGTTTFALPDLRGKVPVGMGKSPEVSETYVIGTKGGTEKVTLSTANLPSHTHGLNVNTTLPQTNVNITAKASKDAGVRSTAQDNDYLGQALYGSDDVTLYTPTATNSATIQGITGVLPTTQVALSGNTQSAGSGLPIENRQPYVVINYIICVNGLFPPRP